MDQMRQKALKAKKSKADPSCSCFALAPKTPATGAHVGCGAAAGRSCSSNRGTGGTVRLLWRSGLPWQRAAIWRDLDKVNDCRDEVQFD